MRTLSLLCGHLLLLFIPPSLSLSSISVFCCCAAAAAACGLAAVAPAAATTGTGSSGVIAVEATAFHFCCVMCGVLGFAAAAASSATFGVYVQQSLAYYWCLGKAVAGPLAAAAALLLHIFCGGTTVSSFVQKVDASEEETLVAGAAAAKKTRILLGICAGGLLATAAALAAALRTPTAAQVLFLLHSSASSAEGLSGPEETHWKRRTAQRCPPPSDSDEEAPLMRELRAESSCVNASVASDSLRHCGSSRAFNGSSEEGDNNLSESFWTWQQRARRPTQEGPSWRGSSLRHSPRPKTPFAGHWRKYTLVFRLIWTGLVCCVCLNLTSYLFFPITLQRMRPCSDGGPNSSAEFQLLLVAGYLLGVLVGRCCWRFICNTPPLLLPGLVLVRLLLLPLLFYLESLPALLQQQPLLGPILFDEASPAKVHLLLQGIDALRWCVCFVFAAAHGYLSLVGLVAAADATRTAGEAAAAAALMTLAETLGTAAGAAVAASVVHSPWNGQWANSQQPLTAAASAATRLA